MVIIKQTRCVNEHEIVLYGIDAEMTHFILSNNLLFRYYTGLLSQDEVENLVFQALSENEYNSYVATSKLAILILKKSLGVNIERVYDGLKELENRGGFFNTYREHVVHQFRVFLLGLYLYESLPEIKEPLYNVYQDSFFDVWAVASLCHDIGYLLERNNINDNDYGKDIVELLNSLESGKNGFECFCPSIDISQFLEPEIETFKRKAEINSYHLIDIRELFYDRDNGGWNLHLLNNRVINIKSYYELTTSVKVKDAKRPLFTDHGIASAVMLFYLANRRDYWIEKVKQLSQFQVDSTLFISKDYIQDACFAIAVHNIRPDIFDHNTAYAKHRIALNRFNITIQSEPLAFLLMLCDGLQDWNRPSRDIKDKRRKVLTSQDIHIIP